jgi:hypothetical protein
MMATMLALLAPAVALAVLLSVAGGDDGQRRLFGVAYEEYAEQGVEIKGHASPQREFLDFGEVVALTVEITRSQPLNLQLVALGGVDAPGADEVTAAWAVEIDLAVAEWDMEPPLGPGKSKVVLFLRALDGVPLAVYAQ